MRKMPITDAFFLLMESSRRPMHVGGLNLYTLPKGVNETEFLAHIEQVLKYDGTLRKPFGEKLHMGRLGVAGTIQWEEDEELDIDYHVRHSALPKPGRYRELFALVSRLHGTMLDRSRPLWEMHLIEGLKRRQFATYFKAHHCGIDGAGAMHLMNSMYSNNPETKLTLSPFSEKAYQQYRSKMKAASEREVKPRADEIRTVLESLRQQLGGTVSLARAMTDMAAIWLGKESRMSVPFHRVPRSVLSTQLSAARRFVAQSWRFDRVRRTARNYDCTLNDIVLAMCSGALRQLLRDERSLPKESLKTMAPVSVRAADDLDSANAVGMVIVDLATNVRDPVKRLEKIKDSMDASKETLRSMNRREILVYTALGQAPLLLGQLLGMGARFPAFSTVISNVPGPRERLYWHGARLDGIYPVSIPFDGGAVNFTVVSNDRNLDFGIIACRKSVPHVQRLIGYMEDSLVELEKAA